MSSALIQIDKKIVLLKSIQYSLDIFNMSRRILEVNQDIVKIYDDVYIESLRERFVYVDLK